ncbi:MAG: peptidase domain-containing ABC transporter [Pseudomonadota bacterium]
MGELNLARKKRLPVLRSAEIAECGLCSMAMVARYHGHDVDLNGLRQRFQVSASGASLRSIMALADGLGFSTRAVRLDLDHLKDLKTPAILHWNLNHFVVLKSVSKSSVVIHDPARGARQLSFDEISNHFTGVALELTPAKDFKKVEARSPTKLRSLWAKMDGFWQALAQVLLLSVLLQLAVFAAPFYLQLSIDSAIQTGDHDLMTVLAVGFGGLLFIQVLIAAIRSWTLRATGFLFGFQMTGNLVRHLMRLPLEYFEKRHVGDILSRVQSIRPIRDALTTGLAATVIDGAMAILVAGILFAYSPLLASVVLGALIISAVTTVALYPAQRAREEEQILASAKEQSHLIETVRANTTIKLMGRETEREAAWRNLLADSINAGFSFVKYQIGMTSVQTFFTGLSTIVVVYFAANMIVDGSGFSIGMLYAFLSYRQILSTRFIALVNELIRFRYLTLHLDRVGDIIQAESDSSDSLLPVEVEGNVELVDLSFRYGMSDPLVFDGVSMSITAGEFIALTGRSGGGKSTLVKLMLGLYPPTAGELILDDCAATPELWRSWRENIGVVSQDDHLLSGTIADNIAFFDPNLDMERVREVAALARIDSDIERMPMKYLSLIGDMGAALSGGQRQRLLIARALYRNPKVLFLDEGTANLDPHTEEEIADLIAGMDITRIVVAHRPALIRRAETVYNVGDGGIRLVTDSVSSEPDSVRANGVGA